VPLEDAETEPIPFTSHEQAEAKTATFPDPLLELSTRTHQGSGEALEDLVEMIAVAEGTQSQISGELLASGDIVKNDARVQEVAKEVGEPMLQAPTLGPVTHSRVSQVLSDIRSSLTGGQ
jgi:hypothetical protein